jgi:hypothetical protein
MVSEIVGPNILIRWGTARKKGGLEAFIKIEGEMSRRRKVTDLIRATLEEDLAELMKSIGGEIGPLKDSRTDNGV